MIPLRLWDGFSEFLKYSSSDSEKEYKPMFDFYAHLLNYPCIELQLK